MSNTRTVIGLFPGQGSQSIGMAQVWLRENADARTMLERAEAIAERPLARLIGRGPMRDLSQTDVLQPALCAVNAILLHQLSAAGGELTAAAGHSLGELSACHAAGAIGFEETIRLATARGRAMQAAAEKEEGGMAAIGGPAEQLAEFEAQTPLPDRTVIANRNAPDQIVLSGPHKGLETVSDAAASAGLRVRKLDVSGAWHSPAMVPAREIFAEFVSNAEIGEAKFPVWSALDSKAVTSKEDLKNRLIGLIDKPVLWGQTMTALSQSAVDPLWVEIGPGKVLTGLLIAAGVQDTVYRCESPRMMARLIEAMRGTET